MTILQELKEARDNAIFKSKIINTQNVGVSRGLGLLSEIALELAVVVDKAIIELEKQENRYELLEPLGRRN